MPPCRITSGFREYFHEQTTTSFLSLSLLVYQSVLPQGLVRDINNYLPHALFNQLNILIRTVKIYIYYYVIVINVIDLFTNNFFSFCITHPYIFDIYLIEHFV